MPIINYLFLNGCTVHESLEVDGLVRKLEELNEVCDGLALYLV